MSMSLTRKRREDERTRRCGEVLSPSQRVRLWCMAWAFALVFAVIALRLLQLHLSPSLKLSEEERMHIGEITLREPRGDIYDRQGQLLATQRKVPSLWADPSKTRDVQEVAMLLSSRLGLDESAVAKKLTLRDESGGLRRFVWIKRWIEDCSEAELNAIIDDAGGAVDLRHEPVRYYPQGDTAAHLLGFVNRAGEASEGIELAFNDRLESVPGTRKARKDVRQRLLSSLTLEYVEPGGGERLELTIDSSLQHSLERALAKRAVECNAKGAMGIMMEPHSGAILALATHPTFDPNFYSECPAELRKNRAMLDLVEPGSAFKIVTAAGALEHGLVNTETMIDCEDGAFNPYGHRITDFHKFEEPIPFSKCFEESSNIALIKVAAMLGEERLEAWIRRFGFGVRTTSTRDFKYESAGMFRPRKRWSRLSMGSLPIGQEISVTMPQLARAFAVLANGGFVVQPYVVERAVSRDGVVTYEHGAPERTAILSPATAATMKDLCHRVVLYGTGTYASIPEYRVGGKTGTAQVARVGGRGYYKDRYTAIFAGFAPISQPRVVCVIVVQEPMIRLHYGGYVCGPVFKEVVREALVLMNVPEDPVVESDPTLLAQAAGAHTSGPPREENTRALEASPIEEIALDDSIEHMLDSLELVPRDTEHALAGPGLPNFAGMTKRQVRAKLWELGIQWDTQGAGRVLEQDPAPGTPLSEVGLCALQFGVQPAENPHETEQAM